MHPASKINPAEYKRKVSSFNFVAIFIQESKIFANRILGIADQFVEYVNKTIQQDLGKCKPVHNFYQSVLVNTLCGSVVDSLVSNCHIHTHVYNYIYIYVHIHICLFTYAYTYTYIYTYVYVSV